MVHIRVNGIKNILGICRKGNKRIFIRYLFNHISVAANRIKDFNIWNSHATVILFRSPIARGELFHSSSNIALELILIHDSQQQSADDETDDGEADQPIIYENIDDEESSEDAMETDGGNDNEGGPGDVTDAHDSDQSDVMSE